MLSGYNGILQKATGAREQTGIGQEKEIVALAYNSAIAKKVGNSDSTPIIAEDLNTELANQGASADGSNPIKVTFTASKRQYTINNGSIEYAGIQNEENPVISIDIYTTVCVGGENQTLLFSNNIKSIQDYLTEKDTTFYDEWEIENITYDTYYYICNEDEQTENYNVPKWCGYNLDDDWNNTIYSEKITKVKFLNEIVPTNTSCWFLRLENLSSI